MSLQEMPNFYIFRVIFEFLRHHSASFQAKSKIERKFQENSEKTLKFEFLLRNLGFLSFLSDSAVLKTPFCQRSSQNRKLWENSKRTLREIWENPRIWFPCQKCLAFTPFSIFSSKNLKLRENSKRTLWEIWENPKIWFPCHAWLLHI